MNRRSPPDGYECLTPGLGLRYCAQRCEGEDLDDACLEGYAGAGRPRCRIAVGDPDEPAYWLCTIACLGPGTDGRCPADLVCSRRTGFCE